MAQGVNILIVSLPGGLCKRARAQNAVSGVVRLYLYARMWFSHPSMPERGMLHLQKRRIPAIMGEENPRPRQGLIPIQQEE